MENKQNNIKVDIINWNIKYPFDYIWRKKFNIPFGSEQHLNHCHYDMMFDLYEDKMMQEILKKDNKDNFTEEDIELLQHSGLQKSDDKVVVKMTQKELDEEFEKIDLQYFND